MVERDVEAPDVFQVTEAGLWDGRPTFGGVWVAYPEVSQPERVVIVNEKNGRRVNGALFRRERERPGPLIDVSSDAARELGLLAGQPQRLTVTAIRTETVEIAPPPPPEPAPEVAAAQSGEIETQSLDAPLAAASAAIAEAEAAATVPAPASELAAADAGAASGEAPIALGAPFVQVGLFGVEENALEADRKLRAAGVVPTVKKRNRLGRPQWRVIVGPARDAAERAEILAQVKNLGFTDAYYVTN